MTKRYFVKFVKPSMNTLCSILNRNLWLSSPIYLNDPDEYWFETKRNILVHNNPHDINDAEIQKNLKKMLEETKEIKRIIDMIKENKPDLDNILFDDKGGLDLAILIHIGLCAVSLSDIKVFNSDASRLMFAHYADNYQGCVLFYEAKGNHEFQDIKYEYPNKYPVTDLSQTVIFHDIAKNLLGKKSIINSGKDIPTDFKKLCTYKSPLWRYENEVRAFELMSHKDILNRNSGLLVSEERLGIELLGVGCFTEKIDKPFYKMLEAVLAKRDIQILKLRHWVNDNNIPTMFPHKAYYGGKIDQILRSGVVDSWAYNPPGDLEIYDSHTITNTSML